MADHLPAGWSELIEQIDEKHSKGHERLRLDIRSAENTIEANYRHFEDQYTLLRIRMDEVSSLAKRPVDGMQVVWTTRALATVFSAALTIASAFVWVGYTVQSLRSEIGSTNRLADERYSSLRGAVEDVKKQQETNKREAADRLTQFLSQSLEKTIVSAKDRK